MSPFGIPALIEPKGRSNIGSELASRIISRVAFVLRAAWLMGWIIYLIMYGLHGGFKTTGDFLEIPVLLFGPPIALLLFGLAAGWAFRGFKAENDPPGK